MTITDGDVHMVHGGKIMNPEAFERQYDCSRREQDARRRKEERSKETKPD